MSDFDKLINASDLIEWIMETYPDWCIGEVRCIVNHVNNMPTQSNTFNALGKNECVSRQAAIEALRRAEALTKAFGYHNVIETIRELPSAHPLDPCETCLHKGKGWDEEPCDGCTQNDSRYEPNNGWIPVGRAVAEWLERNGFIPIPTRSLTDDEIRVLKSIMGEPLEEEE